MEKTRQAKGSVFLDRDGVINVPPQKKRYITSAEEFRFLPGALSALRSLNRTPFKIIIVSNQAGVGRGIFSQKKLEAITRQMRQKIRQAGGRLDAVYYCTHRPSAHCGCRKPRLGLIRKAQRRFPMNLARSYVIGDSEKEVRLGKKAGTRTILVLTGKQTKTTARSIRPKPDKVAKNLLEAIRWIRKQT